MTTVTVDRMAVEIDGQGEPVLMIHGLGGTSNTFTPQCLALASRYRLVRPDLPGSGRSGVPETLSIGALVGAMAKVCEVLGLERAHVAGHSLGTIVAQHLAVERPDLVRSLTLFGPLLAPAEAGRQGLRDRARKAREEGMQPIADAILQASTAADTRSQQPGVAAGIRESLMRQSPEGYAKTCEALAAAEAADIGRIRAKTVLVTGDEDQVAPASNARMMSERIDGSVVRVFSRCGHWTTLERAIDSTAVLSEALQGRL